MTRSRWTPSFRAIGPRTVLVVLAVSGIGFTACDTSDGTVLMEPTAETTLPPPDTTPLPSEPLGDLGEPQLGDAELDVSGDTDPGDVGLSDLAGDDESGFDVFTPWAEGASIDRLYTCDGSNASPSISWVGLPAGTTEVAVSLVDESEQTNGRPFIHWVVAGLDPSIGGLDESEIPDGAIVGLNFFGDVAYAGPCPTPGETHTYRLTVHAVGQQVELVDGTPAAELLDLVESVSIGSAVSTVSATR